MLIESKKDLRKREGRNVSKLTSVYSTHSIRSTAFNTYKDGSVYSLQSMVFPKDLMKSQKDMRKLFAGQKKKKESEMENLHKQFLSQDFKSNFRTVDVECSTTKILKTDESKTRFDLNRFRMSSEKEKKEKTITLENKWNNYKIQEPTLILYTDNSIRKSTNYDFVKTTDYFARTNYVMQFKNQHLSNLKEDKQNEIGQVEEEIQSAREIGKLMTKAFDVKFKEYISSLNAQKEKENSTLEDLKQELLKLEFDLKKLKYNIYRQKVVFEKLVEYRNFLICVKERLKSLPGHFFRVQEEKEKDREDFLKVLTTLNSKKSTKPTQATENSIGKDGKDKRRFSLLPKRKAAVKIIQNDLLATDRSEKDKKKPSICVYTTDHIYETKEEFLNDLNNLEKDSMEAMEKFSKNKTNLNELNALFEKAKREDIEIQHMYTDKIILNEKLLRDLQIKNKLLYAQRKRLLAEELEHDRNNKFAFFVSNVMPSISDKHFNFLQTLSNIHKNVQSLLPKDFIEKSNISAIPYSRHEDSIFKHKLKQIEKIFNVLLEKYNSYKNNKVMSDLLTEIEIEFNKERKSHKAKEQIVKDTTVRNELHDVILKKANSIIVLPKRRVTMRFKPLKRKSKNEKKSKENEEDKEFQDMITYEDEKDN